LAACRPTCAKLHDDPDYWGIVEDRLVVSPVDEKGVFIRFR